MDAYPETPEAVAYGLTCLILGEPNPTLSTTKRDVQEVLRIYAACASAVCRNPPNTPDHIQQMLDRLH